MTAEKTQPEADEPGEFEVLELEFDNGDTDECVVIDSLEHEGREYVLMVLLEDVQNMELLDKETFQEVYGDDNIFFVLRRDDDLYVDPVDGELDELQPELQALLAKHLG